MRSHSMTAKFVCGVSRPRRGTTSRLRLSLLHVILTDNRIRSAKVLLISVKALGTEIAKNLVLGGIESLTIVDNGIVTDDDLGAQYFLRDEDIGKNVCLYCPASVVVTF